jgi:hypothetical protein
MKTKFPWRDPLPPPETYLDLIIKQNLLQAKTIAAQNDTVIVNEVPPYIKIHNDSAKVSEVICNVIRIILEHTRHSCISISAKLYSDVVLIHFREFNLHHISTVFTALEELQAEVRKLAGYLGITRHFDRYTTIALTFTNLQIKIRDQQALSSFPVSLLHKSKS